MSAPQREIHRVRHETRLRVLEVAAVHRITASTVRITLGLPCKTAYDFIRRARPSSRSQFAFPVSWKPAQK